VLHPVLEPAKERPDDQRNELALGHNSDLRVDHLQEDQRRLKGYDLVL
jgi:hypothetical protein